MPRSKQFDTDVALTAAMELFWRKGYEATSVSDLVQHLGIGKASLYATFGSKHELYVLALDRYLAGGRAPSDEQVLTEPESPLAGLRALLERYATAAPPDQPRGCLMVNATVEISPDDTEVTRRLEQRRDQLEEQLVTALYRARSLGEIASSADPRALARFLTVLLNGMRVLSRAGDREGPRLAGAVDVAMAALV